MRTLLHGIFLGGALYAFLGALEVAWALALHPFHRDFGLFLRAIPWNLGLGGVAGMLSALLLPWLTRKAERRAFPGLHMGGALLGLLAGLVLFQWLTLSSLPQRAACAAVAGLLVQQILRWTFLTRMGWRIASLCAPLSVAGLLAATLLLTTGLSWLPVQPGPQAPPRPAAPHSGLPNELPAIKHVYWLHLEGIEQNQLGSFGYHRAVSPQLDQFITESSCVTPPQNGDPPPLFQEARFAAATFQDF
ncbi:MAG: hypothetical protein MK213_04960, partial [Planctomycetes bacterium]|nr:hypothetical protein [Planctomycetota bacterium]